LNTKKISKRILSLLLSIMMVLAMVPMQTVFVADAAVDTSCVGGCNGDHTGYTAITAETWGYTIKKPGNYYLTSNYQCGNSFNITISGRVGNVTICLNGYTLSNTKNYSRIIYVGDGNTVNLCDCKGTGTLEYNNTKANDLVFVGSNSTFNMYGGTLRCATEGVSTYLTTGYYNSWTGGTFNMYGGTISTNGYAVDNSGRFNYYGGTITSTKAEGAVNNDPYTEKGYMTVNGSATFSVYLAENTQIDTSKMTGGKITVNSESDSDNIAVTGSNNSDVTSRFVSGKDDYIILNGDNNVVMLHKHQWQAATCKTLKYCDYCGQYSGELDPNNHDSEETYFKFADNENHNVYYSCCDALKETIPHNADIEANCGDVAYCGDCESSFGDVNPDNHTSEDTYTQLIDDDVHGIYHSCCSALKSTEVHTPVDLATCTNQSSCSVCLSTYGETNGENHTGELIWYTTDYSHIKKWTCCVLPRVLRKLTHLYSQ